MLEWLMQNFIVVVAIIIILFFVAFLTKKRIITSRDTALNDLPILSH